jgi:hypothetical protein
MDTSRWQVARRFGADLVVFVDFAHYADGSHTVRLSGSYHERAPGSGHREPGVFAERLAPRRLGGEKLSASWNTPRS